MTEAAPAQRVDHVRVALCGEPLDTLTQPGMLFGFDPVHGYSGLLEGKKALAAYTSAIYSPGVAPASSPAPCGR